VRTVVCKAWNNIVKYLFPSSQTLWAMLVAGIRYYFLIYVVLSAVVILMSLLAPRFTSTATIRVYTQPELNPSALSIECAEICISRQRSVMLSDAVLDAALVQIHKDPRFQYLTAEALAKKLRIERDLFSSLYRVSIYHSQRASTRYLLKGVVSAYADSLQPYQRAFLATQDLTAQKEFCCLVFAEVVTEPAPVSQKNGIIRGLIMALVGSLYSYLLLIYIMVARRENGVQVPLSPALNEPNIQMSLVRTAALGLLLMLPVLRDGPFDGYLGFVKLFFVIVMTLVALWCKPAHRGDATTSGVLNLVAILVGVTILSSLHSSNFHVAKYMTATYLTNHLFLVLVLTVATVRWYKFAVIAVAIVLSVACLVAVVQYFTVKFRISSPLLIYLLQPEARMAFFNLNLPMGSEGLRMQSFFFHSNQFGHLLSYGFAMMLPFLLMPNRLRNRVLVGMVIALTLVGCVLTQSRGTAILILVEGGFISWYFFRFNMRRIVAAAMFVFTTLGLALLLFPANIAAFLGRLMSTDLSHRNVVWLNSIDLLPRHMMFGSGPGTSSCELTSNFPIVAYEQIFDAYHATGSYDMFANNAHNHYIAAVLEGGVFFLIFQLILYISVAYIAIKRLSNQRLMGACPMLLGCSVAFMSEFVRGIIEAYCFLNAPETGALTAVAIACILYASKSRRSIAG